MKALFDTNVILDVMLDRTPFSDAAAQLLSFVEKGKIDGWICATTVTTIHYLASKTLGHTQAVKHIENLIKLFDVASVNRSVIEHALRSNFSDFEDAVIEQAAVHAGADMIVTRDAKGFSTSSLPVYTPHELLNIISSA